MARRKKRRSLGLPTDEHLDLIPITAPPPANATAVESASEAFWASCPDGCTLESNGTCCWCPNLK